MLKPKHIFLIGTGLLLGGVAFAATRTLSTAKNIEAKLMPRVRRFDLRELVLEIDGELVNNRAGAFAVVSPQLVVSHEEKTLLELDLAGKRLSIQPYSTIKLSDEDQLGEPIVLVFPLARLAELVPDAVNMALGMLGMGSPGRLRIDFSGTLLAPNFPGIPVSVSQELELKPPF